MECPHCGLENPESAAECDCGYDFIQKKRGLPTHFTYRKLTHQSFDTKSQDFFAFRLLISSTLIKILYVLGAVAITIQGLILIISFSFVNGPVLLVPLGFLTLILGNLTWRVTCEFLFMLFNVMKSADKRLRENEPAKTS